ncbi:DUF362 domain-containing protein [bacterium]|nr:MAG: DUF362 domain-containing protein [bacterium]
MKKKVAIQKCGSYAEDEVYRKVKELVALIGGMERFVKRGERILVKPNLLAAHSAEAAATTHPVVVKVIIRLVKEAGAFPTVGDSPGLGTAKKVAEKCGVLEACVSTGTELIDLKDAVVRENSSGGVFKRLEVSGEALGFDGIISVPKLKTHVQMYLTLGVKNIFGCVPGKRKPQWHLAAGTDTLAFAGMILDLYLFIKPRLTIMDAVVAMEGNGPASGEPKHLGLLFASEDAIAMDAVAAETLSARAEDLPILAVAAGQGIKTANVHCVDVVGEMICDVKVRGFKFPPLISANFAAKLPDFLDRRVRKALTARPRIHHDKCTLCSVCVDTCPPGIMGKARRIEINYDKCIRCYCCQEICPQGAITVKEGWLKKIISGL